MEALTEFVTRENFKRGWNDAELARQLNYTRAWVSSVLNGGARPSTTFLKKLASVYGVDEFEVFRLAGVIQEKSKPVESRLLNELNRLAQKADEQQLREIVAFARFKVESV